MGKILSLVLTFLILGFCTYVPREKLWVSDMKVSEEDIRRYYKPIGQQILSVEDFTYDRVWEACENTLIRLGCHFYWSDKDTGEIRVQHIGKADIYFMLSIHPTFGFIGGESIKPTKTYILSILISETNELISVQANVLQPNSWKPLHRLDMNITKNEIDKVMMAFKKELKI